MTNLTLGNNYSHCIRVYVLLCTIDYIIEYAVSTPKKDDSTYVPKITLNSAQLDIKSALLMSSCAQFRVILGTYANHM